MSCKELFDKWLLKEDLRSKVMIWKDVELVYDSDEDDKCEYEDSQVIVFSCTYDKDIRKNILNITIEE